MEARTRAKADPVYHYRVSSRGNDHQRGLQI
nr:MAG TPA: hypothetical protein [Caudoviricetes sp.]